MSFNRNQFRSLIKRIIWEIDMHSDAAVNLLLGTAAQESGFGTYLRQLDGGPAVGVFQMEPATEIDIWKNFIRFRPFIKSKIWAVCREDGPDTDALEANLAYQIAMARVHFLRAAEPLPDPDDVFGLACYWKAHYNTPAGKGTVEEFVHNYHKYVVTA